MNERKPYQFGTTRTGNVAIDMIIAGLAHYRRFHRRVKLVELNGRYWEYFRRWMGENAPDKEFTDDGIAFDHGGQTVIIRRGHRFMVQPMEFTVHERPNLAQA